MSIEYGLEALEPRRFLSATLSRHGVLYIVGTRRNDTIIISMDRRNRRRVIDVSVSHQPPQTFRASLVREIVVQAGRGNDYVVFSDRFGRVPGRHFIYGGGGANCLVGDGGNDYVDGSGDYGDTISGGGGDDTIYPSPDDDGGDDIVGPTTNSTTQPTSGDDGGGDDFGDQGDGSTDDGGGSGGSDDGGSSDDGGGDDSSSGDDGGSSDDGGGGDDSDIVTAAAQPGHLRWFTTSKLNGFSTRLIVTSARGPSGLG